MLTRERLRDAFRYDEGTGHFYWKHPRSNAVRPGQIAGRLTNSGYRQIMLDGERHQGHRLVWLWHTGTFPPHELDHVNGDRDDNRIDNLRPATKSENQQNLEGAKRNNKSGFLGVNRHLGGRWLAQITVDKKKHYLGLYPSPEEAHAAYLKAKAEMHRFQPTPRKGKLK